MKFRIFFLLTFFLVIKVYSTSNKEVNLINSDKILSYQQKINSDTIYIFNFWATWCKPCVEELPNFKKVMDKTSIQKISWNFISMDSYKPENKKGITGVMQKNGLLSANWWWMKDVSPSIWIDKISKDWSGAIPATLVIIPKKNKYLLLEQEFTESQLDSFVSSLK